MNREGAKDAGTAEAASDPSGLRSVAAESRPFSPRAILALLLLAAAAWRVFLFLSGRLPFDSDQAVYGIGALRVLREGQHSILVPGQNYAADFWSYWYALLHLVAPPSVAVMRLGVIPIVLAEICAVYWAARRMFGDTRWALGAAAIMAFPSSAVLDLFMRSSTIMRAPLLAFLVAAGLLVPLIQRLAKPVRPMDHRVFPGDLLPVLLAGLALGWGYWGSPAGVLFAVVIGLTVLAFPRAAFTLLGLLRRGETAGPPTLRGVANILQVAQVALTLWLVHSLWFDNAGPGHAPISQYNEPPWLLATVTLGVLMTRIAVGFVISKAALPAVLAVPVGGLGLLIGAGPVLWHQWVLHRAIMSPAAHVETIAQVWEQLRSLVVTGLPVMSGNLHNWAVEPAGLPLGVRAVLAASMFTVLIGAVIAAVRARLANRTGAVGLMLIAVMIVMQVASFAFSAHAYIVVEPRYLLSLYVMYALAGGGLLALAARLVWPDLHRAAVGLATLLILQCWSCLDMGRTEIVGWTGEHRADRELIDHLTVAGVKRVSCRFSDQDYWLAYKLVYIADESILFAPAPRENRLYIRSERYQSEVDEAPQRTYLVLQGEDEEVRHYLDKMGARYLADSNRGYVWFTAVTPDVLARLRNRSELMEQATR